MRVGSREYAVEYWQHVISSGREVAVELDHHDRVVRISTSATLENTCEALAAGLADVADARTKRVQIVPVVGVT